MKKRCSRCHARLEPGRRTCPYCGTMVRKRRGSVKVASSVGTANVLDRISLPALTGKHLLAIAAVIAAIIIGIVMLGCDSCALCSSCGSCAACSSCGSCSACDSCSGCSSCGKEEELILNGANYNCEYYYGSTLYYVDGDQLIALEDGMDTGRVVAVGHGIECVYADGGYIYYIIGGQILRSPANAQVVSSADAPVGSVLLAPAAAGLEKISGFALLGNDELCYWGQTADGNKVICVTDREKPDNGRMIHSGKYFNVQQYQGFIYFSSGEEATNGLVIRLDPDTGDRKIMYDQKANYYTLSGGSLIVYVQQKSEDGTNIDSSRLIYIDPEKAKVTSEFESFPRIRGLAANDQWIYYAVDDTVTGHTLVYRFSDSGKNHQLVFRKAGSYSLYGIAGSYFTLFGEDAYFICNYDQVPNSITITQHTVLDK